MAGSEKVKAKEDLCSPVQPPGETEAQERAVFPSSFQIPLAQLLSTSSPKESSPEPVQGSRVTLSLLTGTASARGDLGEASLHPHWTLSGLTGLCKMCFNLGFP